MYTRPLLDVKKLASITADPLTQELNLLMQKTMVLNSYKI